MSESTFSNVAAQILVILFYFRELVEANRQYKEKIKQYVRDGTPIENTDIGRISKLVKKIVRENEILRAEKFSTDTGATQSSTIPPT